MLLEIALPLNILNEKDISHCNFLLAELKK